MLLHLHNLLLWKIIESVNTLNSNTDKMHLVYRKTSFQFNESIYEHYLTLIV